MHPKQHPKPTLGLCSTDKLSLLGQLGGQGAGSVSGCTPGVVGGPHLPNSLGHCCASHCGVTGTWKGDPSFTTK